MICIAWGGMPAYAASAIERFIECTDELVTIVSTVSDVPKTCADEIAGVNINWIKDGDRKSFVEIVGEVPDVFIVSGWFIPSFNYLADQMRALRRPVIALCDNRFSLGWKLPIRILYYFLRVRRGFSGYMVPGRSGRKLLRCCGVADDKIVQSLYSGDPRLFHDAGELQMRGKTIVYVGRFDDRKNIVAFARSFLKFSEVHGDWTLVCYGQGKRAKDLAQMANLSSGKIVVRDFAQSSVIAEVYGGARVAVLPSLEDHWGVVVHEAALCGCGLLLSREVGAVSDLATKNNSVLFNPRSLESMRSALEDVAAWDDFRWRLAREESLRLASFISPDQFAENLTRLISVVR